jgi:23S rRNA (pseudouridine1915-N3)-methyltransferase
MIKIIAFGFFKNDNLKPIFENYKKRIIRYYKIELIELKEIPIKENQNVKNILKKEAQMLEEIIKKETSKIYLLSEWGKEYETTKFKDLIFNHIYSSEQIVFILGSAHGFDKDFLKKHKSISLSKMTFPHLLARVMLIEQIYRAVTLEKNISYHK